MKDLPIDPPDVPQPSTSAQQPANQNPLKRKLWSFQQPTISCDKSTNTPSVDRVTMELPPPAKSTPSIQNSSKKKRSCLVLDEDIVLQPQQHQSNNNNIQGLPIIVNLSIFPLQFYQTSLL